MRSSSRKASPRALRRRSSPWPKRRISGEWLEPRTLLSANLNFAVAGTPTGMNTAQQGYAVRTDAAGNVYELTDQNVVKYDASGNQQWALAYNAWGGLGLDAKDGLAVDNSGDVYITGTFGNGVVGQATFGSTSLVATGLTNGFLAKISPTGSFLWAEALTGTGDDKAYNVATDSAGNVYLTGHINGVATIGTGASAKTLNAGKGQDILVAKFDTNGALDWANVYGNGGIANDGRAIAVDNQGNVYVTGDYHGTINFSNIQLYSFFGSTFLLKLDTNGKMKWAEKLNTEADSNYGRAEGYGIAVDATGNVYSTGIFGGDVDLNPNGGDLITGANFVFPDAYVLKLDTSGNFVWASDLRFVSGLGGLQPTDIAVDPQGNVFTTGWYDGTANFAPNSQYLQTSSGFDDIYVSALNSKGSFLWASTAGESSFSDDGYGIAVSPGPNGDYVYDVGTFSNAINSDGTTSGINFNSGIGLANVVTSKGTWDSFLWGLDTLTTRINGVVWNDQNADGIRQSSESGVANVTVELFSGTPGSGTQVASTVTDGLGLYSFNGVAPGTNYYVQVASIGNDVLSTQNAGTDPTIASNVDPTTGDSNSINIVAGQTVLVNAGLQSVIVPPVVNRAFGIPTIGFTYGSGIISDAAGDYYVTGSFDGNTTLGSGTNAVKLSTGINNDFIAKYAPNGTLLWVQQIVSSYWEYYGKILLDTAGNVYVAGEITGNATLGTISLTAAATGSTVFLAKLDGNGNPLWATTVLSNAAEPNVGLAVDPKTGSSYVVGGFSKSATVFTSPVTTLTSAGGNDVFIVKYSSLGVAQWAKDYGGTGDDAADSAAIDPSGNPVITGSFSSPAQFGATTLTTSSAVANDFVAKINAADGSVTWAVPLTSTVDSGPPTDSGTEPTSRIAVDASGDIYSTGSFTGTIQLDPTGGTDAITGTNATFVSKLDDNGNFVWGKAFTTAPNGYDVEGFGIAVDPKGNVFSTGTFAQTINFDPAGSSAGNLTANGASYDIYLSELDTNGNFINVQQFGGSSEDGGSMVSADANGNVYLTGLSYGPSTFGKFTVGGSNEQDIFVARLSSTVTTRSNAPPAFSIVGPVQAVALNAPPQTVPNFIGAIVPGLPGEISEVVNFIVTNDNSGLFAPDGQPAIDSNGTLTYTPLAGAAGTATVTVIAHNNGGTANGGNDTSPAQTFQISLDVNHPPVFTAGKNQVVNENAGPQTIAGWATNVSPGPPDESQQTLNFNVTYQVTAGGPDVLPGGINAGKLFTGPITIDPLTGNLSFTPAPNEWGTALVAVTLQDNGGTANSGLDTSATQTFTIAVNPVNQAPQFTAGKDQVVFENAGPQSVADWATGISAGPPSEANQTLNFNVIKDTNPTLFSSAPQVDPSTGTLSYTPATDASGTASITIDLQDSGGTVNGGKNTSTPVTFNVTVNFVNQPPTFASGGNVEVLENSGDQTIAPWATGIDPGAPLELAQKLTFLVTTQATPPGLFSVAPSIDSSGNLTFTPATDEFGTAQVSVQLQDDGRQPDGSFGLPAVSAPQNFTITVGLVNHAPSFTGGKNQTLNENAGPQTVGGWASGISAGPASEAGQALNFIIAADNPALFSSPPAIDPATGTLTYTPAADVSGTTLVSVQLHDDGGTANAGQDTSPVQTFTVTVNFVNQTPLFTVGADQTVHETPGPQTVTGWATGISAGDPQESNQKLTFAVSTDNNSLFSVPPAIDPATGNLTYTPATYAVGTAHVSVQLNDDGREPDGNFGPTATSASQQFTITVTPSNQAPSFTPGGDVLRSGSFSQITVPGWATKISAGPPNEAGQAVNFSVSTDNNALFAAGPTIDPTTGDLTFTPVPQTSGQAHVTVQLHDNGGTANGGVDTSPPVTFLISITFVNQAPSFNAGGSPSVLENAGPQTVSGWATAMAAGPADEASQSLNFVVSTDHNSLFSVPPAIDPVTGDLTYTPAPDANGMANVTVRLHDNGGTANGGQDTSLAQTFAITVVAVNQQPFFTAGANQQVLENPGNVTVKGWATGISPGAANEASQSLNFQVTTDNSTLFPTPPSIDPLTGNLTFTPANDEVGTAKVSVALHDNGGTAFGGQDTSPVQTFTVTVLPVNQPPTITLGPNQTIDEDAGAQTVANWATGIGPGGPNETGQVINSILSTDNPALFSALPQIDLATGTLTYAIAPKTAGTAHVTVQLHDDGGTANGGQDTSAPQTFTITANFVNDPPSFTLAGTGDPPAANENSGGVTVFNFASQISPSNSYPPDPNEGQQTVHFNVTNDSNPALFSAAPTIDASGNLHYAPAANASGTADITIAAQDNGGTANGGQDTSAPRTFTITVNFVNQPPAVTQVGANPVVTEGSPQDTVSSFAAASSGPGPGGAAQQISFLVQANNASLFAPGGQPAIDSSGTLTFTPAPLAYGSTSVTLQAQNSGGTAHGGGNTSTPVRFFIEIDRAITLANPLSAVTANESNQAFSQALSDLGQVFDDVELTLGDHLALSLVGNTNPGLVAASLSSSDPATAQLTLNFQPNVSGNATIDLRATDAQGLSADDLLQVTVNPVPIVSDHSYVLSVGNSSTTTATQGLLEGVTDPNNQPLKVEIVSQPKNGTLVVNADGSFTYTKGANFPGLDNFTYQVTDGNLTSDVATVGLTAYEATVVTKLYNQVLGRSPDAQGLEHWVQQVESGQPYGAVAQGIFDSPERLDPIIHGYYQQFLGRSADSGGLGYWYGVWVSSGGPEPVVAGMISSPEFYAIAGRDNPTLSPNAAWVTALYERLLSRQPDADGLAYWTNLLDSGTMSFNQVVSGFNSSPEYYQGLTNEFFQQYLGRKPDASELATYVALFESGSTQSEIQIALVNSPAYANSLSPPAAGTVSQLS